MKSGCSGLVKKSKLFLKLDMPSLLNLITEEASYAQLPPRYSRSFIVFGFGALVPALTPHGLLFGIFFWGISKALFQISRFWV